ncbi:carbon-nitrogen hydrolase family protein [Pseudoalteromonas luteoviolacea]|uniref:carbon-nitrogen hydrolase family protein n=1 Tax=Pseudoalteromonas luteoviolacea TaxID=43657 RepID=UPI001B38DCCC|nr:carbon-nitrogen hydrolase family protein [Pseudoalteromonas luteoviolacea]MBQ4835772.1 carbon-nitrogen hydrolase family protein [Pseudoalteromonas luteoviolacea]
MKIAVAQSSSIKGDIKLNIENHLRYIEKASSLGVNYLVFPELSLSGYEPQLAAELAMTVDDTRIGPLIAAAKKYKISVGVGAPLRSNGLPKIGLIIIHDNGNIETYEKIYLHAGEEQYFSSGDKYHLLEIEQSLIANAICADTINPKHAKTCAESGAIIYVAGVLITPQGYENDAKKWSTYASEYSMLVAIANYNKPSGGLPSVGKSAIWYENKLLAQAGISEDALVVAESSSGAWIANVYQL